MVLAAVTSVEMNMTVIVSFCCIVEKSRVESEVGEELLSEGEVDPLCLSSGEVSSGGELG